MELTKFLFSFKIDFAECSSNPCQNGVCVDRQIGYDCICDPGWEGTNCDTGKVYFWDDIDPEKFIFVV